MDNLNIKKITILKNIIGFVGGFILFVLISATINNQWLGKIEGYFFPVAKITEFNIAQANETFEQHDANFAMFSGQLIKYRDCEFLGIEAYIVDSTSRRALSKIMFLETDKIRPPGTHAWGPWVLRVPFSKIVNHNLKVSVIAHHKCHPFWHTVTTIR